MKKFLVLLLALVLLLVGCASRDAEETSVADTTATTAETTPLGFYDPDSAIESETGGAVRLYRLEAEGYRWLSAIGDQLLLAADGDPAELILLTGADCVPTASVELASQLLSESCQTIYSGFAYYNAEEKTAVFLDPQLQEINRVQLPEDIQGKPVFSPDGGEIFYCVGQEIRGFEVERKLSRLIKSHTCTSQTLLDCYFDGKLLACQVEDAQGNTNTIYVSTETGQTEMTDNTLSGLYTYEDRFLAVRMDGSVQQRIVGTKGTDAQQLNISDVNVASALELGGILGYSVDNENALQLSYYDLTSGTKTAAVQIKGAGEPQAVYADRWSGCIWLLAKDPETGNNVLLRWDIKASAVTDETVYTGTLYTAQAPDEAGLEVCEDRCSDMGKTYGVSIRIWNDAVKTPGEYTLEPEHQTVAINALLDQLEPVLAEFPKNFLLKSVSSKIRICIVRSIDGQAQAVQYWDKGDAFIVLSPGVDVRNEFMKALGYVVNSHVLGNSTIVDDWTGLNPEGFIYGETTFDNYLKGDERAFVDEQSMQSVTEDRSRIFWQAMLADNAEMFKTDIMQQKLLQLCQGIRDAWGLERKEEVYPWEQYLNESIAYQK